MHNNTPPPPPHTLFISQALPGALACTPWLEEVGVLHVASRLLRECCESATEQCTVPGGGTSHAASAAAGVAASVAALISSLCEGCSEMTLLCLSPLPGCSSDSLPLAASLCSALSAFSRLAGTTYAADPRDYEASSAAGIFDAAHHVSYALCLCVCVCVCVCTVS